MSPSAPATLDAESLQRLRELDVGGKNRLVERVLGAFDTSATRLAQQLRLAREQGDMDGVRHVAHTLKSSSWSIGALELSRRCAEIEASIREGSLDRLPVALDGMDRELDAVLQAVRHLTNGAHS